MIDKNNDITDKNTNILKDGQIKIQIGNKVSRLRERELDR